MVTSFYDCKFFLQTENTFESVKKLTTGKYGYDFVHIWVNTDYRNPEFRHISRSALLIIFRHGLELRENVSFISAQILLVRQYINCLSARKLKARN